MLWLGVEEGVGDAQMVEAAQLQHTLSIVVHLPNTEVAKARFPGVVICSYPSIEVTQDVKGFGGWYDIYDRAQLFVEGILCFWQ